MEKLKHYLMLSVMMLLTSVGHAQIELTDLGWVYHERAIDGYVAVRNVSEVPLHIKGVRSVEDNVMSYDGGRIVLQPDQGIVVKYKSLSLSRKFPGDMGIICNTDSHPQGAKFNIPVKLVLEAENGNTEILEKRFTPELHSLRADNSGNLDCFRDPVLGKGEVSDGMVTYLPSLSGFTIHEKPDKGYRVRGKLILRSKSDSTYELIEISSLETRKNRIAKHKKYEMLLSESLEPGLNIIQFQWDVKKLPEVKNGSDLMSTTINLLIKNSANVQKVSIPLTLTSEQFLNKSHFNTTKL